MVEPISWLVRVVHFACHGCPKNSLLHQTDLLHNLLTWTRDTATVCVFVCIIIYVCMYVCIFLQPTCNQMKLVLFLASCAATDPITTGLPPPFSWGPEAIHIPPPLTPGTPPPLREKVRDGRDSYMEILSFIPSLSHTLQLCQCLVEWLGVVTSDPLLRQTCLGP